jgi:hypothetical protein
LPTADHATTVTDKKNCYTVVAAAVGTSYNVTTPASNAAVVLSTSTAATAVAKCAVALARVHLLLLHGCDCHALYRVCDCSQLLAVAVNACIAAAASYMSGWLFAALLTKVVASKNAPAMLS